MNPIADFDAFANALAEAAIEAFIRATFVVSCIGLSVACGAAILARRKRG
jgi:hypothetical protein